ncbi:MAG: hypothetical protein ACM3S1_15030 [Hyphomicrobiales bacterium]
MHECAICRHLGLAPRLTDRIVGLVTSLPGFESAEPAGRSEGAGHVMVPACPEHVVDVYSNRVPGIEMAWRVPLSANAAVTPAESR